MLVCPSIRGSRCLFSGFSTLFSVLSRGRASGWGAGARGGPQPCWTACACVPRALLCSQAPSLPGCVAAVRAPSPAYSPGLEFHSREGCNARPHSGPPHLLRGPSLAIEGP